MSAPKHPEGSTESPAQNTSQMFELNEKKDYDASNSPVSD
ncbi:hypothetical protein FOXYS1_135, partial [Fusarium oxysporum]